MSFEPRQVHPTRADPLIGWLSEVVGGRRGRRAGPTAPIRGWRPRAAAVCVLLVTASMLVAILTRQPCRRTLWASPGQFTNACYSDIPTLFSAAGLSTRFPYVEAGPDGTYLAQPVGTGVMLKLIGLLTPGGADELRWVFDAAVIVLTLAAIAVVLAVAGLAGHRPWDAALVAGSPVLVFTALVSLDLVAVAATLAAVLALRRDRAGLAGLLLGLAVCVRPVAVVVLIAVALVQWRRPHWGVLSRLTVTSVLTWFVVNLPVALAAPAGWSAYWSAVFNPRVGTGSVWGLPEVVAVAMERSQGEIQRLPLWSGLFGVGVVCALLVLWVALPASMRPLLLPVGKVGTVLLAVLVAGLPLLVVLAGPTLLRELGGQIRGHTDGRWILAFGCALTVILVGWLVRRAPRPPRLATVTLLLLIGFQFCAPMLAVQAALWVLPFAALAVPSWRDLLIWGWAESFAILITWFHLYAAAEPGRGAPPWVYALAVFVRFGALTVLGWQALARARWPVDDEVRRGGHDDPCLPARVTATRPVTRDERAMVEAGKTAR